MAARAGVSRTTVSFVLNERPGVQISATTRNRVLDAAKELGYRPHPGARHLAGGRSSMIGLVLHETADQMAGDAFLADTVRGLARGVSEGGYRVVVDPLPPGNGGIRDLVRAQHLDGIILYGPHFDDIGVGGLVEDRFPTVVQGSLPESAAPSVDVDNAAGARAAVAHLVALGRRRVACVTHAALEFTAARERLDGYRAGLADAGIAADDDLVVQADFDAPSGRRAIERLIERGVPFDAVFATSDTVAIGVIGGLDATGTRCPDDVAVIGFDDIPLAAYLDPPLTTVRLPAFELGLTAGRTLLDVIAGRPVPARTLLPSTLVVRGSTATRTVGSTAESVP